MTQITKRQLDRLSLRGMRFDCIVGLFDFERNTPQPVELEVTLHFDTREAAHHGKLVQTVDYARLLGELRFILTATRFRLLESAAEAVAAWVLAPPSADVPRPQVEEVDVRLSKLVALSGAAVPTLEIHRDRSDFTMKIEPKTFGFVDVIFETKECGVYRERISAKTVLPTHVHRELDESELVLGSGFLLQGKPVEAGVAHTWPRGFPHRYENPTEIEQSFLCIDRPAFIYTDEVEVDVPVSQLTRPEPVRFF
ncbi:MAG: dihydroneopterin aldolase [Archangium sp.]|nr:dihydroneopterin aldolase [Archangium sp.]MDP3152596.1 dihydroneopterin aldolase [Archangium sp.]MDP3571016.1 dihydroneopterin aldolase [Archangium sp.]